SGETVSVRFYTQGAQFVATSIHIYAASVKQHTFTGTVLSHGTNRIHLLDRGTERTVTLTILTRIRETGKAVTLAALKNGAKIRVTGVSAGSVIQASRIDILPSTTTKTGHLTTAYRGSVMAVQAGQVTVRTAGSDVVITIGPNTKLVVRKHVVPTSWLFAGPTASIAVTPSAAGAPTALEIDFHPAAKTFTGDISSVAQGNMGVLERKNQTAIVDLAVAAVTDDGHAATDSALLSGLHVKVDGFLLASGQEAALSVAITHPSLRLSGSVTTAAAGIVDIRRTSGAAIPLHFSPMVKILSAKTNQWFAADAIPVGAHVSVRGLQEAGWVQVSSATVTFKSEILKGVVSAFGSAESFRLSTGVGGTVTVNISPTTKVSDGREIMRFSELEVGDTLSVRAYPDANGGVLATTIGVQRKLLTRTGYISNLTSTSFVLILRDDSTIQVYIGASTTVAYNSQTVPISDLTDGEKVHVEGHLRPDTNVDATKITIEA
ncbi:MAG TPA: DUF5666 domain-containing protein, partial [Chloroflexota bacterium]|nr:DUF5666 domain-containing protein [Chloroflexota bacterium]